MNDSKVKITIKNNGPIRIEGADFEICDASGAVFNLNGRSAISICRCGHSQNQPFCDGNHAKCAFVSDVVARELPPK